MGVLHSRTGSAKSSRLLSTRILFAPRGDAGFGRFVAIARHITVEAELYFVLLAPELGPKDSAHLRLLADQGRSIISWHDITGCNPLGGTATERDIEYLLQL